MSAVTDDPAYWNDMAARYAAMAAPFTGHFARASLADIAIGPGVRLADIATGTGALALWAADQGATVTAIDFAPAMVASVAARGHPRVIASEMDGQALDLPTGHFDIVASVFGVMLFPDWRAGLAEMARVCRPGGTGVVTVWRNPEGAAIFQWVAEIREQLYPGAPRPEPASGMIALSDPTRLAAEMVAAGFANARVRSETRDFQLDLRLLDDPDKALAGMPLWSTLSPSQRSEVQAEMTLQVKRSGATQTFPISSTALIATATLPG